jgi:hypothetical protein
VLTFCVRVGSFRARPLDALSRARLADEVVGRDNFVGGYDYDHSRQVVTVCFRSSGVYEYYGVPQSFADEFAIPHPWHRVYDRIKAFRYQQIA